MTRTKVAKNISTHAPRTGSDHDAELAFIAQFGISTHAPRTGSDVLVLVQVQVLWISTHAPRTGSDTNRNRL